MRSLNGTIKRLVSDKGFGFVARELHRFNGRGIFVYAKRGESIPGVVFCYRGETNS